MTDKELKTKILAEIEKLKDKDYKEHKNACAFDRYAVSALDKVISFINSLPEEPVSKSWRLKEENWKKKENVEDASYQYIYDASNDWMIEQFN